MTRTPKSIREDFARAKNFMGRTDYLRTRDAMMNGLHGMLTSQIFGRDKFEIQAILDESMQKLNEMPALKKLFPNGIPYDRGKEKALFLLLKKLHSRLEAAMKKAGVAKTRERLGQLDDYMIAGQKALKTDPMEARKMFRKASDEFADIEGLNSDIGNRMAMAGLFQEAMEYIEAALKASATDRRAHLAKIMCYEGLNETDKALDAIIECMKKTGADEDIRLRLATLALSLQKWDLALDNAQVILDNNPANKKAAKIVKKAEPKVMAKTGGNRKKGDPIKLDF